MSSLAATQADGFYHPPDWDPQKESLTKFVGSKGSNQYEQYGVIRFEMPHHAWCEGCGRHIGRGTRFNAKKDRDGKYYSTTIWRFTMKCPSCSHVLVIRTDPAASDYEFFQGIRRKVVGFDSAAEGEAEPLGEPGTADSRVAADPMRQLEHTEGDKRAAETRKERLARLQAWSEARHANDYANNAVLRRLHRGPRREEKARRDEAAMRGLAIRLATPSPADAVAAAQVEFKRPRTAAAARTSTFASVLEKAWQEALPFGGVPSGMKRRRSDGEVGVGDVRSGSGGSSSGSSGSGRASLPLPAVRSNPLHLVAGAKAPKPIIQLTRKRVKT
ncbi:unnamed protein product [Phaeothamnion confervicola]